MTEMDKGMAALSDKEIRGVFCYICDRNCRNNRNCQQKISEDISVSEALNKVEDFRKHLWINPEDLTNTSGKVQNLSGRHHRIVMLIDNLFRLRNQIEYKIGYDQVTITIY